jgi:tetratricopeptide (TPR) repeat protein
MIRAPHKPYPGSRPFQQGDHDLFFGRKAQAALLVGLWQANRLTIVAGPAASGKTSLLQAGVLPALEKAGSRALPLGRVSSGSTFPFAALPRHNPYTLALLRSWSPGDTAGGLVSLNLADFVRQKAEREPGIIFAAIDQAEELSAQLGSRLAHRRRFLGEMAEALQSEPRLHLLIVVRDDAFGLISGAIGDAAVQRVSRLSLESAAEAVTRPAQVAGRSFGDEAAEQLLMDLRTCRVTGSGSAEHAAERHVVSDEVEPSLLQVACSWLWNHLPVDRGVITAQDVRRHGDVTAALADHLGRIVASVAEYHGVPRRRLRSWLVRTFVTETGTRDAAYEGGAQLAGVPNGVARALEDLHLLCAHAQSGARWYQLLSDRLIEPLRQAVDQRPRALTPESYLSAAGRAMALGELEVAARYASAARRSVPVTDLRLCAQTRSLQANLAHERDDLGEAQAGYRDAAVLYEAAQDTEAVARHLAAIGRTLAAQGRHAEAADQLRAAVDRSPSSLLLQTNLGLALWRLGDRPAAIAVLTGVLEIDGGNQRALRARGEILAESGEPERALLDLDRVSLLDQPFTRAACGLALAELGDHLAADREVEHALAEAPENGAVLLTAARVAAFAGAETKAAELARRALEATDPSLSSPYRQIALLLAR